MIENHLADDFYWERFKRTTPPPEEGKCFWCKHSPCDCDFEEDDE